MKRGNAEPYLCAIKIKARTGGKKGRRLLPRHDLPQKVAEGKTSYELSWKVKCDDRKKKKIVSRPRLGSFGC